MRGLRLQYFIHPVGVARRKGVARAIFLYSCSIRLIFPTFPNPDILMTLRLAGALFLISVIPVMAQPDLTVDMIMQKPETWIGAWPSDVHFTDGGDYVYFRWNPEGQFPADSLYRVPTDGGTPELVSDREYADLDPRFSGWHAQPGAYSASFSRRVFQRNGDLYLYDLSGGGISRLTHTVETESNPRFVTGTDHLIHFQRRGDVYRLDLDTRELVQLTDLRSGNEPSEVREDEQQEMLRAQQVELFDVVREAAHRDSLREAARERRNDARGFPPRYYYGNRSAQQLTVSADERYATFVLVESTPRPTTMSEYVNESGFVGELQARPKVGSPRSEFSFVVQHLQADTSFTVDFTTLPGAYAAADYQRAQGIEADSNRVYVPLGPYWSPDGRWAVMDIRTHDNKDRWIVRLDPEDGSLTTLDHQRDEAWIAGPGISGGAWHSSTGWTPDSRHFWFHSEVTGYSHLYRVNVETAQVEALTSGDFEVTNVTILRDGRWLLQTSEGSPFERHYWIMPADGGSRTKITEGLGRFDAAISPDESTLASLFSVSNHPPEVYVQSVANAQSRQRITHSTTDEWLAYPWREAEIIHITASDGVDVPARIYRPENPNGAAVVFVHGAGYLQNVHHWWSSYFREYMFHNMLADQGFVVLDLDFRASSGYGRDWRTAIYRHMGGRDLQDNVDASRYLTSEFGIPSNKIGIYGGSYGGFITLMALFNESEYFGAGAALRAVTDWAHYNDGYTGNILNYPVDDPEAYLRSSPIYFAEGLNRPLLMTHGLVDVNVQPQDIFRLTQRFIELGKTDWELAIFPVEDHGFVEPSSWRDQYRRIHELFVRHLLD